MSSSEWKRYKLGEICVKIGSGATPKGGKESYLEKGDFALVRSQNVLDFFFSYNGLAFINDEQANKLNNVTVKERDVLLNITGDSVARVCQIPKGLIPARVNQHVAIIRPDEEKLNSVFLKYYLLSPTIKGYLLNISSVGATRNAITKTMIEELELKLPDIGTQQQIASILSSLDDKIELNRQTNQTLEAMAQALFQEMCVPKGEGLPKGWRVGKLGENIKILNGFAFKGVDFIEKGVPVIKIKNVKAGKVILNELSYVSREVADKTHRFRVNQNDLLITMSGNRIDGTPDTWVGKVGLFHGHGEYLLNQRVSKLVPENNEVVSNYFLCQLLSSKDFQYHFISNATSSGGQANISPDLIKDIDLFIPPITDMKKFNESMKVIYEKIFQTEDENQTLIALRDTLLPKLMRGEINVESL